MSKFVHLHTHSHYSLLDGMSKIPDLVEKAKSIGAEALALTDHGNLYGAVEFYKACKAAGIKPILGVEAYVAPGDHTDKSANVSEDKYYHLVLLVKNETGWKNLIELVTESYLHGFYYRPRMDKAMLRAKHEGLIALSGCLGGEVAQALFKGNTEQAEKVAREYQEIFGKDNYYIEVQAHEAIKDVMSVLPKQIALAQKLGIPLVATQDSHYLNTDDRPAHDILLAIQTGKKITDEKRFSLEDDFSLISGDEMAIRHKDTPEAIENTIKIADQCNFNLELGKILLPKFDTPNGEPSMVYLRKLVAKKTSVRYPLIGLSPSSVIPEYSSGIQGNLDPVSTHGMTPGLVATLKNGQADEVKQRVEYELSVVEKMGFADYFLIVADFINWAKDRGVVVGPGRGSAAGSIISYILGITDLDPLHYGLLFERFLNPERIQMPDIDVDITDIRRDEVFGYLVEKYGENRVAHIITFGTMAARAAIRDVGRAMGIEYSFCDQLSKLIPFQKDLDGALEAVPELAEFYKKDERAKKIIDAARRLEGVARHASVHACGTVIAAEPITKRVPLQHAPQDDKVTVTQFEMHAIEDLGLLKIDILGLKNLTIIEETIRIIKELTGKDIKISEIPLNDKKSFELLQRADTTGIFQLESGGMRRYLKQLIPTELEDIIAMVALYRPGPIELIPSYIARKHGKEQVTYLHPKLEPIMRTTYGIGIYQEQMMKIASDLASYTLAQADTLRKAIGKKIKKLLAEQQVKLTAGMIANGIPQKTAEAIWELFPPFARYGFNRCLTGDTEIQNPTTGEIVTIERLYKDKKRQVQTFSLNEQTQKIYKNRIVDIVANGEKPVFEVTTRSGRKIKATANHPFFTAQGWQTLENLKKGQRVATPRILPAPTQPVTEQPYRLAVLGYLLAEGNLCHPHGVYFYSKSEEELNDYRMNLERFENTKATYNRSKSAVSIYSGRKNLKNVSEVVEWITSLGLKGKKATEKTIPDFVFRLDNHGLALLIAKMFQGDGCIALKGNSAEIYYATSSRKLSQQLQHLFLRLGILSTIHNKAFRYRGGLKYGYTVSLSRHDNIRKFLMACSPYFVGQKKTAAEFILKNHPLLNGFTKLWAARGSKDIVPTAIVLPLLREAALATKASFAYLARTYQFSERLFNDDVRKIGFLRETVQYIGGKIKSRPLQIASENDVYWDEIVSIKSQGVESTYDLSMEKDHNFIANNFFVHNSHAACYALIAYQTAYLKANYPEAFMTALLNADSGDVERVSFLIDEAKKMKIEVLPPDINKSSAVFTPEGANIRFGMNAIKNVGNNIISAIIEERSKSGEFTNFPSFLTRVIHKDLNKKSLESLTKCGALDSFGLERNQILENIDEVLRFGQAAKKGAAGGGQTGLFGSYTPSAASLKLKPAKEAGRAEKLAWEKELLGLYVSDHPLNIHKDGLNGAKPTPIKQVIKEHNSDRTYRIAGMVSNVKNILTKTGKPMLFAHIEDQTDSIEVVVFNETLKKSAECWKEGSVLVLTGKVSTRNGNIGMICDEVKKL
ncbi:MAG: DNA polymerase III subunit alpha [bacterium]|nr:DNA polymerase III subunit alpha [bacterium]